TALFLVLLTAGSMAAAVYYQRQERLQRSHVKEMSELAERNQQMASENEAARLEAETTLVDMQTSRGLLAGERDDPARALLWFAQAAEQAASDPTRQAENRLRARNWARTVTVPLRAFPLPGTARIVEFHP